jgi:hypothetical protein
MKLIKYIYIYIYIVIGSFPRSTMPASIEKSLKLAVCLYHMGVKCDGITVSRRRAAAGRGDEVDRTDRRGKIDGKNKRDRGKNNAIAMPERECAAAARTTRSQCRSVSGGISTATHVCRRTHTHWDALVARRPRRGGPTVAPPAGPVAGTHIPGRSCRGNTGRSCQAGPVTGTCLRPVLLREHTAS